MWSGWLVFCDYGFHSVCPLMEKDKRLMEASWWERLTEGETGSCSYGWGHAPKSWIQFSVDERGCVPSLLFDPRPNYGGGNKDNGDLFKRSHARTAALSAPDPAAGHHQPTPLLETPGHWRASLAQSLVGSLLLSPGSCCTQCFVCAFKESVLVALYWGSHIAEAWLGEFWALLY